MRLMREQLRPDRVESSNRILQTSFHSSPLGSGVVRERFHEAVCDREERETTDRLYTSMCTFYFVLVYCWTSRLNKTHNL
jgi:hypothetical protein